MRKTKKNTKNSKYNNNYIPHNTNFDLSKLDNDIQNQITGGVSKSTRPVKPVSLSKKPIVKSNIYDLSTLADIENDIEIKKKENTKIDRDKLLIGYDEVPQVEWESLTKGVHIRYLRKNGFFRKGGFIKDVWIGLSGENKGKNVIRLCNNMSYKAVIWTITFDQIDKIWKKKINIYTMPSDNKGVIDSNKESIEYLTTRLDQFAIDISKINNEQQRIVNLIKKLHNIRSRSTSREN
jgi:hypothetical protein